MDYVIELLRLAKEKGLADVLVHLITDGRSSRSERVPMLLDALGKEMKQIGIGRLVTLVGRGFALDRGGDYESKTRPVYNALVLGHALPVSDRS